MTGSVNATERWAWRKRVMVPAVVILILFGVWLLSKLSSWPERKLPPTARSANPKIAASQPDEEKTPATGQLAGTTDKSLQELLQTPLTEKSFLDVLGMVRRRGEKLESRQVLLARLTQATKKVSGKERRQVCVEKQAPSTAFFPRKIRMGVIGQILFILVLPKKSRPSAAVFRLPGGVP